MKNAKAIFQTATVFVGTIVGAGLASGQEINQFFTSYGFKGFYGLLLCGIIYIILSAIIIDISLKYNLNSYTDFISLVSPGFFGAITDYLTSFFLISNSAIIMAGSGALLYQYFHIPKIAGILIMAAIALITLLNDTKGLITINSFIVPSLTIVILTVFTLHLIFAPGVMTLNVMKSAPICKNIFIGNQWLLSTILYTGFNMLSCSGVIVPLTKEIKQRKILITGLIIGAVLLTAIGIIINMLLIANSPEILNYEIPLLYVSSKFIPLIQIFLLVIIWCEMFSTEVSDIFSVGKTIENKFHIPYKRAVVILILIALPISQIGFKRLINFLYPGFGLISAIFLCQCVAFYFKMNKAKNK